MKIQKVKAPPAFSNNTGVNCVIANTPTQRITVQNDIATPRIFVGKISESNTHGIGPSDDAKHAMNPSMKMINHGPLCKIEVETNSHGEQTNDHAANSPDQ